MKNISVNVHIDSGDIWVELEVSNKDYKALATAIEEDENYEAEYEFRENPKFERLYKKLMEAALDQAANGAMDNPFPELGRCDFETNRKHIAENFELWADYSDVNLDGDIWE